jgi:hypothetical protein
MTSWDFDLKNNHFCDYDHKFAAAANLWDQPLGQRTLTHSQSGF